MYWLNLLYALICLSMVVGGLAVLIHLCGVREHGPDCRVCCLVYRAGRLPR